MYENGKEGGREKSRANLETVGRGKTRTLTLPIFRDFCLFFVEQFVKVFLRTNTTKKITSDGVLMKIFLILIRYNAWFN